jgi:hypothetical protein
MRTTVELPDELLTRAKVRASATGVSLKQFFIEALERSLDPASKKARRILPVIGRLNASSIGVLTAKQIDEAMFG